MFTIEAATIETYPLTHADPMTDGMLDDWHSNKLGEPLRTLTVELALDRFDAAECSTCGAPVGARLAGEADELLNWHVTVVVASGNGTSAYLCEDCGGVLESCGMRLSLELDLAAL